MTKIILIALGKTVAIVGFVWLWILFLIFLDDKFGFTAIYWLYGIGFVVLIFAWFLHKGKRSHASDKKGRG